ncbi:MAG: beta-ketoacyl synthase N-terminal-like domain-containing protein [Cyanobacteria bacterium P01_G01_bin.19]
MQSKLETLENAKHEPIAVVGMGCRFPGANNPAEFWQLLCDGKDAITTTPGDRRDNLNESDRGGFVPHLKEFDASFFRISPREAVSIDPQQRLLLEVSWEALENAAIPADKIQGSQTGVFIGIAAVDYWHQLLSQDNSKINAYLTTGNTHSLASGRISHFFNFTGSSISLDTACSSSLVAVHLAIKSLRDRECNMALAGGVNRLISPKVSLNFSRAKMLSPDGLCKTFDDRADGFVRSEGCGIVVLKRLSEAISDRDNIRAVLLGSATNQDGRTSSITTPSSLSQQAVIKQALTNSKIDASQVSYIETHGTGTALGDAIELEALSQVFRDNERLILGAVKTNIGHLESAAGIASLIKTVLALENNSIPANLNLDKPNTNVEWEQLPFKLPHQAIAWNEQSPRIAGISSFGFSGTNAHLIIREADISSQSEATEPIPDRCQLLFTISARNQTTLDRLVAEYVNYLTTNPDLAIADICLTTNIGRSHFNHRLACGVTSTQDLKTKLIQYRDQETSSEVWQGKANLNREIKLAVISPQEKSELPQAIASLISSPLVSTELADVIWQIGNETVSLANSAASIINSAIAPESNHRQILISGIAQLYTLGVNLNWSELSQQSNGKKIVLPTYPFQRSLYWFE